MVLRSYSEFMLYDIWSFSNYNFSISFLNTMRADFDTNIWRRFVYIQNYRRLFGINMNLWMYRVSCSGLVLLQDLRANLEIERELVDLEEAETELMHLSVDSEELSFKQCHICSKLLEKGTIWYQRTKPS